MSAYDPGAPLVYMVHPDTGGASLFPNNPLVITSQEARGWVLDQIPFDLDPHAESNTPPDVAAPSAEDRQTKPPQKSAKKAASTDDHEGVKA